MFDVDFYFHFFVLCFHITKRLLLLSDKSKRLAVVGLIKADLLLTSSYKLAFGFTQVILLGTLV